jgi:hypothetical protein
MTMQVRENFGGTMVAGLGERKRGRMEDNGARIS